MGQRTERTLGTSRAQRRQRRSGDEVRRLLLDTAQDLFAAHGFSGVSTRTIAAQAGVSERLVFAHFGSKAGLFDAAVLEPFSTVIDEFVQGWRNEQDSHPDVLVRRFVRGMYDMLRARRRLVVALIAATAFEPESIEDSLAATVARLLAPVEELIPVEAARHDYHPPESSTLVRATIGMIMSVAVLDEFLYEAGTGRPTDEELCEDLIGLLVGGIRGARGVGQRA